jgi:hypothetical protein
VNVAKQIPAVVVGILVDDEIIGTVPTPIGTYGQSHEATSKANPPGNQKR